jgi:putative transcription factor
MDGQDWKPVIFKKKTQMEINNEKVSTLHTSQSSKKTEENPDSFKINRITGKMGKQISEARVAKKISQKQLANMINLPQKTIQDYENGKAKVDGNIINKLNRVLNIKIHRDDKK